MIRTVDPTTYQIVRDLVSRTSIPRAARKIGIADATITRIVADLPVQAGTALLVETAAKKLHPSAA